MNRAMFPPAYRALSLHPAINTSNLRRTRVELRMGGLPAEKDASGDEDSLSEEAEGFDEEDEDEDLQKEDDEVMLPLTNDTPMNESDDLSRSDDNPDCIRSAPTIEHQKESDLLPPERMDNRDYRKQDFSWFYYNAPDADYKCKTCEMSPECVIGSRGKSKFKFGRDAVKSLTDHPRRILEKHNSSEKHKYAIRQYEESKLRHTRFSFYKKLHFWGQASSFLSSFLDHFKFANFKNLTTKNLSIIKMLTT